MLASQASAVKSIEYYQDMLVIDGVPMAFAIDESMNFTMDPWGGVLKLTVLLDKDVQVTQINQKYGDSDKDPPW